MPKPTPSNYPIEQRWRFVQRSLTDEDLLNFSENIAKCHNKKIDNVLDQLLSFLPIAQRTKHQWLSIWINVLHQMGLGYSWDKGKYIYATELCYFLNQSKNTKLFYLYWALKFQFPFGFPKQKHYIDNKIAVQPVVLILQHLLELNNQSSKISQAYLAKNEITKFLMKSKNHKNISQNSKSILDLRNTKYNYLDEENIQPGFLEAGNHLFGRGRLFIGKISLIKFDGDKIKIKDKTHLQKIIKFLSFVNDPITFNENTQDMRNWFFSLVYNNLDPYPQDLQDAIDEVKSSTKRTATKVTSRPLLQTIKNPKITKGSFSTSLRPSRKFQAQLRKDVLVMYDRKCCMCGLNNEAFLRAAHIIPVEVDPNIAADRMNCLMLCVIHDIAFEEGLIYVDDKFHIQINKNQISKMTHTILNSELINRINQKITLPKTLKPKKEFLERHKKLHYIT